MSFCSGNKDEAVLQQSEQQKVQNTDNSITHKDIQCNSQL